MKCIVRWIPATEPDLDVLVITDKTAQQVASLVKGAEHKIVDVPPRLINRLQRAQVEIDQAQLALQDHLTVSGQANGQGS